MAAPLFDVELTTTLLMAQLGIEDVEVLQDLAAEASAPDEYFSNEDYALRIQAQYIRDTLQIMEDRRLALTFDQGLEANHPAFCNDPDPGPNPPLIPQAEQCLDVDAPGWHVFAEDDESDDESLGLEVQHLMDRPNSPDHLYVSTCSQMLSLTLSLSGFRQLCLHRDLRMLRTFQHTYYQ